MKFSKKLASSVLAVALATTMLLPTVVFAQDVSNVSIEGIPAQPVLELSTEIPDMKEFVPKKENSNLNPGTYQLSTSASALLNQAGNRVSGLTEENAASITTFQMAAAALNTDPNNAIYIPADYYGYTLYDVADANEHWYLFETLETSKISFVLSHSDGYYVPVLYNLDLATGMLNPVALVDNGSTFKQMNYIGGSGIYFMQIIPVIPSATPYDFAFILNATADFDASEAQNNDPAQAQIYRDAMTVSGTIDNAYDEDWFILRLTKGFTMDIDATYAPSNTDYAVVLYDANFNLLGNFYIDGVPREIDLSGGDFYVQVISMTGNFTAEKYAVSIMPKKLDVIDALSISETTFEGVAEYVISPALDYKLDGALLFNLDIRDPYDAMWEEMEVRVEILPNRTPYGEWVDWMSFILWGGPDWADYPCYFPADVLSYYGDGKARLVFRIAHDVQISGTVTSLANYGYDH